MKFTETSNITQTYEQNGMQMDGISLREHLIGQALVGILASGKITPDDPAQVAKLAYRYSQAVLNELELSNSLTSSGFKLSPNGDWARSSGEIFVRDI
jgi:hypothetical protein